MNRSKDIEGTKEYNLEPIPDMNDLEILGNPHIAWVPEPEPVIFKPNRRQRRKAEKQKNKNKIKNK